MAKTSLKSKALSGILWSLIDKVLNQGVQFAIAIALARALSPSDFGVIGMLSIFLMVSNIFVDGGFSSAIIQKKDRTEEDFSTVFYINIIVGLLVYSLLYMAAPFIADFYDTPLLTSTSRVLFLTVIINSLYLVQNSKLTIAMNFKARAKLNFFALVGSGCVALYYAYHGAGAWALVYQALTRSIIFLLLITIIYRWRPLPRFSTQSFNRLFKFGSKLLVAGVVATFVNNLYAVLIGRYFTTETVGYYTQGKKYTELLSNTISGVLQGVTYPIMTSVQDDTERLVSIYKRVLKMTSFVVIPSMIGLAMIAEPFVKVFLTDKWLPSVIVIQWLCFARVFTPISALNMNILNATGRSDLFLKIDLIKIPMMLGTIFLTAPYGLEAIVIGNVANTFISFFINAYYPGKFYGYGALSQIKDMTPIIFSSLLMALALYFIKFDNILIQLGVMILSGIMVYCLAAYTLRVESMMEIATTLRKRFI